MTDNNHTEEITEEVERLFKEAHQIEPVAAEGIFYGSLRASEEEKRDSLKNIISGEYTKYSDACDASDKLRKLLMRLRMLGELLDITNEGPSPDEETIWVAGDTILQWTEEAEEARSLLADRWSELERRRRQEAQPATPINES